MIINSNAGNEIKIFNEVARKMLKLAISSNTAPVEEQVTTDEHDYKNKEILKRIILVKVELVSTESM